MREPAAMNPSERRAYTIGREHFERGDADEGIAQLSELLRTRKEFADHPLHKLAGWLHF